MFDHVLRLSHSHYYRLFLTNFGMDYNDSTRFEFATVFNVPNTLLYYFCFLRRGHWWEFEEIFSKRRRRLFGKAEEEYHLVLFLFVCLVLQLWGLISGVHLMYF